MHWVVKKETRVQLPALKGIVYLTIFFLLFHAIWPAPWTVPSRLTVISAMHAANFAGCCTIMLATENTFVQLSDRVAVLLPMSVLLSSSKWCSDILFAKFPIVIVVGDSTSPG